MHFNQCLNQMRWHEQEQVLQPDEKRNRGATMEEGKGLSGYLEFPIVSKHQLQLSSDKALGHSPNHNGAEANGRE